MTTATPGVVRVLAPGTLTRMEPADCTPTQFATAEQKAKAANTVLAFIEDGLDPGAFTPALYRICSLHLFGHVAEYDRHGFADTWFSTPHAKAAFIVHALNAPAVGDPAWTWCDVEAHIQGALRAHLHLRLTHPETFGARPKVHACPHCTCT
ncbi:hypothetical protein ABZW18_31535 [Streptomyces sp. NPDC004647]|uniref:hypothetical protein n=1 Tax=Streptomyces sp. NPDC004647 TaxID=3154671 RepID=UPI0033A0D942